MSEPPQELFDRLAGGISYMPTSGAGCAIMGATIVAALILVGIGELAGRYFDSAIPVAIGWALAVTCLVAFMRFAARNS